MFENRVLRRILGAKKDEVTGEWRKLHNEELNDLYCSRNIVRVIKSRRMRWAGHVARMTARRDAYTVWVQQSGRKRTFGRQGHIWDDNIKKDLQDVRWGHEMD